MKTTTFYALGFLSFIFSVFVFVLSFNLSPIASDIFRAMYSTLIWLFIYFMFVFFVVAWLRGGNKRRNSHNSQRKAIQKS